MFDIMLYVLLCSLLRIGQSVIRRAAMEYRESLSNMIFLHCGFIFVKVTSHSGSSSFACVESLAGYLLHQVMPGIIYLSAFIETIRFLELELNVFENEFVS